MACRSLADVRAMKEDPTPVLEIIQRADKLAGENQLEKAKALYAEAYSLDDQNAYLLGRLARFSWRTGEAAIAEKYCRDAITIDPECMEAYNVLGKLCMSSGRREEAEDVYRKMLKLDSARADIYNNLGNAVGLQKRPEEAAFYFRKGIEINPDAPELYNNLGQVLRMLGLAAESEMAHRKAVHLRAATPGFFSNWLLSLNYLPQITSQKLYSAHKEWARRFAEGVKKYQDFPNSCSPDKRLRVGYVSPDFRKHPVASFVDPILAHHNKSRIDVYCYADIIKSDDVTRRLHGFGGVWRMTRGLTDDALCEQIRADRIDILVDLAGHTMGNRLLVFAARPAPVQISYLGYCNTTGLSEIDYRISDAIADPPGSEACYTEKLRLLDSGFSCYSPPLDAPAVSALPAGESGPVTFGSLNMLGKLNVNVIKLWCEVLRAVPDSRLLIFRDELRGTIKEYFRKMFAENGIGSDRVQLESELSPGESYLSVYGRVDILLDTFPWNGHTTACEALWMGVPVLTLPGTRHSGRMCASVLTQLGLDEFIAKDGPSFVGAAVALAKDRNGLIALRQGLRPRMTDYAHRCGRSVTSDLEKVYRQVWQEWCEQQTQ